MNKRIVIKIGPGSLEAGYAAAVQIGEEGLPPRVETQATLPPAPDLAVLYQRWQQSYWDLGLSYRLEARSGITNISDVSKIENCRAMSRQLRDRIHHWLNGDDYRPIREKLLEQLSPQDSARIILQTQDPLLQRLPWYELHFFDRYRNAEVGVCSPSYQQTSYVGTRSDQVRILAVLGDATGLNTQIDKTLLSDLPNVDIHFLEEPSRESFNQALWDVRGWDILYFAGHSSSHASPGSSMCSSSPDGSGEMLLSATEKLTIPQLKHALKKAIERGLNTAIFNSCDGLGLAADLSDLHIPQTLVMREPVPDRVAHAFLQGFLESFAAGTPFYLAVREAREKLQGLEARFPCATWLPTIVQNLAETPPTWLSLQGRRMPEARSLTETPTAAAVSAARPASATNFRAPATGRWRSGAIAGLLTATALLVCRQFGWLQPLELKAYDHLLRSRPTENVDSRLLIITNTEADIARYPNTAGNSSLSDETLQALLEQLTPLNPALIGLDIYRSQSARETALAEQLETTDNLIAICKVADHTTDTTATLPPPEIEERGRIGASDFVADSPDEVLRRHLMALAPPPNSPCQVQATFSTAIAPRYLKEIHGIPRSDGDYIGTASLPRITQPGFGSYRDLDTQGYQILLNYRTLKDPAQTNCGDVIETPADCMTVSEVLSADPDGLRSLIEDRIVLIGTTAAGYGDRWLTPYTRTPSLEGQTPGVFLQAQMISQLVSAALDNRLLLSSWAEWQEMVWIAAWAVLGGCLASTTKLRQLWLSLLLAEGILLLACWLWLVRGSVWVPWVPSAIALPAAALARQAQSKIPLKDQSKIPPKEQS